MNRFRCELCGEDKPLSENAGLVCFCCVPKVAARLVSDIDMAILGAEEKRFNEYEELIRVEYAHVPDEAFYAVRGKFIRKWLNDGVYQTALFSDRLWEKTKGNLTRLLATRGYATC